MGGDEGGSSAPAGGNGGASNVGNASPGFNNVDKLNLGSTLQIKSQGRAKKHKKLVRRLLDKGFK